MPVELEIKPLVSLPEVTGWSQTVVLSQSPQQINPENQPVWIVALASNDPEFADAGMEFLDKLEKTYHSLELKTSEALYQTLNQLTKTYQESVSFAAAAISLTTITPMTYGQAAIILVRDQKTPIQLLKNDQFSWAANQGEWRPNDIWWFQAGQSELLENLNLLENGPALQDQLDQLAITINQSTHPTQTAALHIHIGQVDEQAQDDEGESPQTINLSPSKPDHIQLKKRRTFALGVVVLLFLLASVLLGARAREKNLRTEQFDTLTTMVTQKTTAAEALYAVDQTAARAELKQALDELETAKVNFEDESTWAEKWQTLYDQTNSKYQTIAGELTLAEIPVWYPLNTIKSNLQGTNLDRAGTNLVVWDQATVTLIKIDIDNKRNDIIAGGQDLNGASSLAVSDTQAAMLTPQGIVTTSLTRNSSSVEVKADPEWSQPQLVGLFNNNLYLVDPGQSTIYRYPAITGGVGAKQNWLGAGVSLSGTTYNRIQIDGQIWLLQPGGKITRYTQGAPQNFSITGLDLPLGNNTPSFSVHPDLDLVAILDADNQRIVITTKTGQYQKQIAWSGLSTASDIVLSEDGQSVFILKQGNIYQTNASQ